MRLTVLACAFLAAAAFAGPAFANMCRTDSGRTCGTGMPVDGYCMCGDEGGTVMGGPPPHRYMPPPPPPPHQ